MTSLGHVIVWSKKHKKKDSNISHVIIENMGGRDQSQVKNKIQKVQKKLSPFQKTYQKS